MKAKAFNLKVFVVLPKRGIESCKVSQISWAAKSALKSNFLGKLSQVAKNNLGKLFGTAFYHVIACLENYTKGPDESTCTLEQKTLKCQKFTI